MNISTRIGFKEYRDPKGLTTDNLYDGHSDAVKAAIVPTIEHARRIANALNMLSNVRDLDDSPALGDNDMWAAILGGALAGLAMQCGGSTTTENAA